MSDSFVGALAALQAGVGAQRVGLVGLFPGEGGEGFLLPGFPAGAVGRVFPLVGGLGRDAAEIIVFSLKIFEKRY
jgi:hypothetical protein